MNGNYLPFIFLVLKNILTAYNILRQIKQMGERV
jgi:hypothetical protein